VPLRPGELVIARMASEWPPHRVEVEDENTGEIEAAICQRISRFEQEYMGRGPKDIHTCLVGDLLVVRLHGVLTAAEQQLVKSLPGEKGRDLLNKCAPNSSRWPARDGSARPGSPASS